MLDFCCSIEWHLFSQKYYSVEFCNLHSAQIKHGSSINWTKWEQWIKVRSNSTKMRNKMAKLFILLLCYRNYFFDKTKLRNIAGNEISLVKTQTKLTSLINPGRSSKTQFNSSQCTNLFMYLLYIYIPDVHE